jgi:hypothetical protein
MVFTSEDKARARAQKALETGKDSYKARGTNKEILEEVRQEIQEETTAGKKRISDAACKAVDKVEKRIKIAGEETVQEIKAAGEQVLQTIADAAPQALTAAAPLALADTAQPMEVAEPDAAPPVEPQPSAERASSACMEVAEPDAAPVLGTGPVNAILREVERRRAAIEELLERSKKMRQQEEEDKLQAEAEQQERARLEPGFAQHCRETYARIAPQQGWPAEAPQEIYDRAMTFFKKRRFSMALWQKHAPVPQELLEKRDDCFGCRTQRYRADQAWHQGRVAKPFVFGCARHAALTVEQRVRLEFQTKAEWAEEAFLDAVRVLGEERARAEAEKHRCLRLQALHDAEQERDADLERRAYEALDPVLKKCAECKENDFNELCAVHQAMLAEQRALLADEPQLKMLAECAGGACMLTE